MTPEPKKNVVHCAVYTRKSSEEGLDQSFNSLDAQREACEAFILSQRQEGWRVLHGRYDDGGYSGGTLERPALKRLLADVEAGKVDTIIVYKVDRLTRSLADFAKIVEAFDARGVSFVSVTQQFNTTSSMGRLTLNVLLSFAQFEREVTGERIRDKIAASKRKGMWMGGRVPLGYDAKDRKLLVNPEEAKLVRKIFILYLKLGCVSKVKRLLDKEGSKSKVRVSVAGKRSGGGAHYRGALYQILKNRIYLGEVAHRGQNHPGEHQAIVPRELWDRVQSQLSSGHQGRRNGLKASSASMLVGVLQDAEGNRFTPSQTSKNGRRYRYYVSQAVIRSPGSSHPGAVRLPAHDIESQVVSRIRSFLRSDRELLDSLSATAAKPDQAQQLVAARNISRRWNDLSPQEVRELVGGVVKRVVIREDKVDVLVSREELTAFLMNGGSIESLKSNRPGKSLKEDLLRLEFDAKLKRHGLEVKLIVPPAQNSEPHAAAVPSLLKAVARAHSWYGLIVSGKACTVRDLAREAGLHEVYVTRILRCAYLAPDIVEAILDGRQPADLTLQKLCRAVPMSWAEQRRCLGLKHGSHGQH